MKKFLLLFFISQLAFSQSQKISLEDKIYNAVDIFVAHPNAKSLAQLESFEKSISTVKTKPELLAFVIMQCNKGYYENQFGFTQKAIKSYEKAWQIFEKNKLSHYDITESCLKPLGNLYAIIGDYDNAENTIKQYYYIANVEKNQEQKYAAILNLSNVYQNTGRQHEAIDLLEKTLQAERLTNVQKGILYNNLGNNYFLLTERSLPFTNNPFQKGEEAYKKAILLLQSEKNQTEPLSNAYRNLAKRHSQNYDLANSYMEKAKKAFFSVSDTEPRKKAQFFYEEAFLLFKQGNISQAESKISSVFATLIPGYSRAKSVLPNEKSLYAETVLLDALDLQSELFLAQDQPQKAIESYQLAFHVEELFQSLLVYENSKIVIQIRNRNRTQKCIGIYDSLYRKEKKISYIEAAFLLAEKTKSAVLKQSLLDSKTQSREQKLIVQQLQNWNTVIVKEQQKLNKADISKINEAIRKQNELMLLLKSESSEKSTESGEMNLADLYLKLGKNQAMLMEYFAGSNQMYLFIIENKKIKLDVLVGEERAILNFINYFNDSDAISKNPSQFNSHANSAYSSLKIPKTPGRKNLIIIPDGMLALLPFEALVTETSSTSNFAQMKFLLYDYAISYSNSADFYLNSIPFRHTKETVLGIFPVFEKTKFELAFSKNEMQSIQSKFDGMYLQNGKATFQGLRKNAAHYSILHLSTHASSGDLVSPASIKFYEQEVLYSELYALDMQPDLVVLSACETGIGKLFRAEGAMSVARGFQFAGAQNLLFSLWKVNDYTTSVFMDKFYSNVKKGKSYFESCHQAKLDYLADENIPNAKKSPYYWSSFVYYGTLDKKGTNSNFFYIALALGAGIGLFFVYRKFRKTT